MTSRDATAPRKRNPVLTVVDIVAAVLLVLAGLGLAINSFIWGSTFMAVPAAAGAGVALLAIGVLAFIISTGMVIVNLIRRRYTFWWPLGGVLVTIAAFYITFAIAGAAA
jgi:hypothetical protein